MKHTKLLFIVLSGVILFSCADEERDNWPKLDEIKKEVASINKQINSIQTLVDASNKGKLISELEETMEKKEFLISFNDGKEIEIITGEATLPLGIKKDEGNYYWTITSDGESTFLLDSSGNKLVVTKKNTENTQPIVDNEGYWIVNKKRIKDANAKEIKAIGEKNRSFFKELIENEESITFELTNGTSIIIPKSTETSLNFIEPDNDADYFLFNFNENKELKFKARNIVSAELTSVPKDWIVKLNLAKKTITVKAPPKKNTTVYTGGLIKIQGLDKNGQVYMAVVDVRASIDFTDPDGTFIVCEGNMSSANGMLAYYDKNGKEYQAVFKKANDGLEVGNVLQDMYIANGKIYLLTQNGDRLGGAGRFVVCDARTLKMEYADSLVIKTPDGKACWPQHLVVTGKDRIYVQYSEAGFEPTSGICALSLGEKSVSVENTIDGTYGTFTIDGATKIRMVYSRGKVYAGKGHNVIIINPESNSVEKTIPFEGQQVKGIVKAADGNIYITLAGKYEGKNFQEPKFTSPAKMVGLDHSGNIISEKECPVGIEFPTASWSPGIGMCASFTEPYLYFADTKEFQYLSVSRYNYETKTFDKQILTTEQTIYGIMGVHPTTQQWWVPTSSYVDSEIFVYQTSTLPVVKKKNFKYPGQNGASPAGVDFTYRFSNEFINK